MHLSYLLLSAAFLVITACSSTPPPVEEIKTEPVIKADFAKILDGNFRGLFSIKGDRAYFKTCDINQEFKIHTTAVQRNIYEQITSATSTPVYIEFTGEIVFPEASDSETEVLMRIDRVHYMALAKSSLQCAKEVSTFRFKAKGDEPYWRLNINDQKLSFATKARNQVYQINDIKFRTTQMNNVKSINKEGQHLNLTIEPGHCYDLKNNEYWGYTAQIDSVWGSLQGCGELGWPLPEQKIIGYYLNKTPLKISNLALNANYTVEYSEKTGEKTILRTGFWKSNSPDRVVVMLTRQKNKKIREELIFTRKGLTLTTEKINKNNIISKLKYPGLIFKKMNNKEENTNTIVKRTDRKFTAQLINPSEEVDLEIQKAVNQYFEMHRTDPKKTRFNAVKYDLNGDGIKEAIVLLDWCSNNSCEMLVFKGSKKGYLFSSRVSRLPMPITIAQNQRYLWQSLLIEKDMQTFKLDFDGISYPANSNDLKPVNRIEYATDVILFNQGIPKNWFPIKQ